MSLIKSYDIFFLVWIKFSKCQGFFVTRGKNYLEEIFAMQNRNRILKSFDFIEPFQNNLRR
jgi:hypothetical protein